MIHRGRRRIIAAILLPHGVAHLVGTSDAVAALHGGSIEYLAGSWPIANNAILIGWAVAWTAVATGFAVGAVTMWARFGRPPALLRWVVGASTILCIIGLPETSIGLVVNVFLIAAYRIRGIPLQDSA